MVDILTCPSQLKMKNKTECFFFMCDWFVKLKHLLFLCTINITLAEFIHIRQIFTIYLYVWYYYTLSYFLYTLVYRCFQLCSTWIKLLTVLLFLKQIFFKKCYPEHFSKDLWITYTQLKGLLQKRSLLPYIGSMFLQSRTKLKKSSRNI